MPMPRFTDERVSLKISSGVANRVNELPSWEMVWPAQNFQKSELILGRAEEGAVCSMPRLYALPLQSFGACPRAYDGRGE